MLVFIKAKSFVSERLKRMRTPIEQSLVVRLVLYLSSI
jgi:hypothetical protein